MYTAPTAHSWPLGQPQQAVTASQRPQEFRMPMPSRAQRIAALARLELTDSLRSRWLQFAAGVYVLVFGAFVWLGLRESSVLGFTGLSRVVLNVANATVVAVPLVALVATCQAIAKARTSGHLELVFTLPTQRSDWFLGLLLARLLVLLGPLVALLCTTALVGALSSGQDAALLPMIVHALLVSTSLVLAYVGLGLLVSALAQTLERAVAGVGGAARFRADRCAAPVARAGAGRVCAGGDQPGRSGAPGGAGVRGPRTVGVGAGGFLDRQRARTASSVFLWTRLAGDRGRRVAAAGRQARTHRRCGQVAGVTQPASPYRAS